MSGLLKTWITEWNDIVRDVIFPDTELRSLMELPENVRIVDFIHKYFIRAGFSNDLVTDEPVRIIYGDLITTVAGAPHVLRRELSFDIYVKKEELNNYGRDRLMYRTELIAARLIELLTSRRYNKGFRFWVVSDNDMGTTTVGYVRRTVSFNYMRIV